MAFWDHLWASWGDLGAILGVSWGVLGGLGGGWRRHGSILGAILGVLERLVRETLLFACFFQIVFKFSDLFNIVNH